MKGQKPTQLLQRAAIAALAMASFDIGGLLLSGVRNKMARSYLHTPRVGRHGGKGKKTNEQLGCYPKKPARWRRARWIGRGRDRHVVVDYFPVAERQVHVREASGRHVFTKTETFEAVLERYTKSGKRALIEQIDGYGCVAKRVRVACPA